MLTIGELQVFTLEQPRPDYAGNDEPHIEPGSYELKLSLESSINAIYRRIMGEEHKGMIALVNVPNRRGPSYLSMGNTSQDAITGPVLGLDRGLEVVSRSEAAYRMVYPMIAEAITSGGVVLRVA